MRMYVKINGKVVGPLEWEKILRSAELGRLGEKTTVSDDKILWLSIPEAKKLMKKNAEKEATSQNNQEAIPKLKKAEAPVQNTQGEIPKLKKTESIDQQPYQQSNYQQPGYQQPGYQQPGYQQPGYQQPGLQPLANQYQPVPSSNSNENKSTGALVLGVISLIMWLIPIIGVPVSVIGLVLGCIKKYNTGIILNVIGLSLSIVNAIIGAVLGAQGKLF